MTSGSPISHIETPSDHRPAYSSTAQNPVRWWRRIRASDIFWLVFITVMLVWPWIFFSQARDGIQMPDSLAIYVNEHPHRTNFFFVTVISTLINMIVAYLFSKAVIRFSQEWITKNELNLFHLSLISGFSTHKIPWGPKDIFYVCSKSRILRAAIIIFCWAIFIFVQSGITSLLGPAPFERTLPLQGTELDLSTNDPVCLSYLRSNPNGINSPLCGWATTINPTGSGPTFNYTTCLVDNQLVDVLESGRGNVLSLIQNNAQTIDYSQLSGRFSGLRFLGSIRGVLPLGLNGVPGFDTVLPDLLLDTSPYILDYNYTLLHQGLNIGVSCNYDTQSPINTFISSSGPTSYNATCGGQTVALNNETTYQVAQSPNSLMFWACKSPPNATETSYSLYLQGSGTYGAAVGNMTCTVSQAELAIFPVTYNWTRDFFATAQPFDGVAPTFTEFIDLAVGGVGNLIAQSQSYKSNGVGDSILTFGVKFFGLDADSQNPGAQETNQNLCAQMIQGVLEYLATYSRLLYAAGAPPACARVVDGSGTYTVFGWSTEDDHIGLIMPLTIVNLASLVLMILAIIWTTYGSYQSNPTEVMALALAQHHHAHEPQGWKDKVTFRDRQENLRKIRNTLSNFLTNNTAPIVCLLAIPIPAHKLNRMYIAIASLQTPRRSSISMERRRGKVLDGLIPVRIKNPSKKESKKIGGKSR
ncbi:hypothetical protein BYT27DRAFT_7335420 [Phlegmacium glaucopus]|nr:hypothetical protein BYT27DRAFT_7335420 [Phlegmacium glaucopus]